MHKVLKHVFLKCMEWRLFNFIPDEPYLKILYRVKMGRRLDLNDPKAFTEKIQWLKLYDRNPEYTTMVDKYAAKKWVADRIGEQYIIPTLGVWDHFDDIDFDALPDQFVLKCTHDSGSIVVVKDKGQMDRKAARKILESGLRRNWYDCFREWAYKDVPPRIIAEKYMVDESGTELKDYKVFNFDGEPRIIQVDYNRFVSHMRNLYTTDWKYIEAAMGDPTDPERAIKRPEKLEEMLCLAKKLSAGFPHVRTDFYSIEDRIFFGELTFYHEAGLCSFSPESFDYEMGEWLRVDGGGVLFRKDNILLLLREGAAERHIESGGLTEYKIFCFNGEPGIVLICQGTAHREERTNDYCDLDLKRLPFTSRYSNSSSELKKPEQYEEMLEVSRKLSAGIPQLRVDIYIVNGQVYIGELTLYHNAGLCTLNPREWDKKVGDMIRLPEKGIS